MNTGRIVVRQARLEQIRTALRRSPVAAILGPRQCGKTTLARDFIAGGRCTYFDPEEAGPASWERLWIRGGFPASYLAGNEADSLAWREGLIRTYLQRDIPELGIHILAAALRRFWTLLAHYHGRTWNVSEVARSLQCDRAPRRRLFVGGVRIGAGAPFGKARGLLFLGNRRRG